MTIEEAYRKSRDIEFYIEQWEKTKPKTHPLIEKWREYVERKNLKGK